MQKLGQHFLKDTKVLEKIAGQIDAGTTHIIEIGPGHGELTKQLRIQNKKAKIISIEKDSRLAQSLTEYFFDDPLTEIVEGDALKILPYIIEARKNELEKYTLIGNIPYYITGYLLRTVSELDAYPEETTLLIQKEVAERITSHPPEMNRLAASVQFWGDPKIVLTVPPGAFNPPPKVDSAVINILTKKNFPVDKARYYETVRLLFAQPRKTILNNLSEKISKKESSELLEKLDIPLGDRPQNLSIEKIVAITEKLY